MTPLDSPEFGDTIADLLDQAVAAGKERRDAGQPDNRECLISLSLQKVLWDLGRGTYLGNGTYVKHDARTVRYIKPGGGHEIVFDKNLIDPNDTPQA